MFEVIKAFKMSNQTFFLSVQYMDRYFNKAKRCLEMGELHQIGITCMFVASKFEDIIPLFLITVTEKIAHGRISKQQILDQERDICAALDFKLAAVPTVFDFLDFYLTSKVMKNHADIKMVTLFAHYLAYIQVHHI